MDRPSISGAVSTTCTQRFLVRGRYPANLQCCVGVLSLYRVWWDNWPCSVPANLTTSISTAAGRSPSVLCRSVGITLVKEKPFGDRSPFHRTPVAGWFVPFFIHKILQGHQWLFSAIVVFSFSFELLTQGYLDQY